MERTYQKFTLRCDKCNGIAGDLTEEEKEYDDQIGIVCLICGEKEIIVY